MIFFVHMTIFLQKGLQHRLLALLSTFLEGVNEVECVSEAVGASMKVAKVPLGLVPLPLIAKLLVHLVDFDF